MGLWSRLNRAMVIAAGVSVLAAWYAVAAWGQVGGGQPMMPGNRLREAATVTVASLRIPAAAWRHFERAKSAEEHHRDAEFDRESARALEIAPDFAPMYILRATVEVGGRHFEAAVASVEAAMKADPGTMWAGVVLAGAYNGMHRFNDALMVLNGERGLEAESWQAMYERARAETGLRDAPAAMLWSGRVLGTAPAEFLDAHLVRANAQLIDGHLTDAMAQMNIYLRSKGRQMHRVEVLAALNAVRTRIDATQQVKAAELGKTAEIGKTAEPGKAAVREAPPSASQLAAR